MDAEASNRRAAWRVADLEDGNWIFRIDDKGRAHLAASVRAAFDPDKDLFDYARGDFDLGPAADTIAAAIREAHHGRGLALIRGLPRDELGEAEFRVLNWAIGLHHGVARPQGKATQYMSEVRDIGSNYRSAGGRGFSSNARLDFHADSGDLVTLGCYNKAKSGGQSMISSSISAYEVLKAERPDLFEVACQDFCFSRQQEQAEDEGPFVRQPLFDICEGRISGKWNRNRVQSAQQIEGVPPFTPEQRETMDMMDAILSRPDIMFTMWLEPGDLQILNNHKMLHSRTDYVDHEEPAKKRLLHRLWLAPPDSLRLPDSWKPAFRSVEPGTVRGGIRGHHHDAACRAFETMQAAELGMPAPH